MVESTRDGDKTGLRESLDCPRLKLDFPIALGSAMSGLIVIMRMLVDSDVESWSISSWVFTLLPLLVPAALACFVHHSSK